MLSILISGNIELRRRFIEDNVLNIRNLDT